MKEWYLTLFLYSVFKGTIGTVNERSTKDVVKIEELIQKSEPS